MKYLPYLAIALSVALLLGLSSSLNKERSERKAMDRLHSKEIIALRARIELNDKSAERVIEKAEWMVDEVRAIVNVTYSKFIPIDGGWLAVREEKP